VSAVSIEAIRWAWGCRGLRDGPRVVLLALATIADPAGEGAMHVPQIGAMAEIGRTSVHRHLAVLEGLGLVGRDPQHGRGRATPFRLAMADAENVPENVPKNVPELGRLSENVPKNVPTVGRFRPPTRAGVRALSINSNSLSLREDLTQGEIREARTLQARVSPQGARAREVAAYSPTAEVREHLAARGMAPDEVERGLAQYRDVRGRNAGAVDDDNFRVYMLQTFLPRILGREPLPDMRAVPVSRRTAENVATALRWRPPEGRGRR
jgi:hypothetical protein